jgi:putative serine protease PepD
VILIFGVGLFSGWTLANSHSVRNTPASSSSPTSSSTSGNNSNAPLAQSQEEAVIAKVEPSVVQVQGPTSQGESIGSGIIIDKKGDIVTNHHVVVGTNSLEVVLNNGKTEQAQVIGTNPQADLAVIRIQPFATMAVATLGDSSKLTVGQTVVAIGNPLGYSGTATEGVVSALNRSVSESNTVTLSGMIQTSAAINPGNSGGALISLQGEVVGITTLTAINTETNTPANGLGFAIPSNQIKTAVAQIVNS